MGDCLRVGISLRNQPPRPTQSGHPSVGRRNCTCRHRCLMNVGKYCSYIVKYDLATRTKTTQLPSAFSNVTDICSSVDTGKLDAYHWSLSRSAVLLFGIFIPNYNEFTLHRNGIFKMSRICIMLWQCLSHTRTVVRECCKGDDASQWENGKFDPLPPTNPLTDRHKKLHTWLRHGYLPTCKI